MAQAAPAPGGMSRPGRTPEVEGRATDVRARPPDVFDARTHKLARIGVPVVLGLVYGYWVAANNRSGGPITGWNLLLGFVSALVFAVLCAALLALGPRMIREAHALLWTAFVGCAFGGRGARFWPTGGAHGRRFGGWGARWVFRRIGRTLSAQCACGVRMASVRPCHAGVAETVGLLEDRWVPYPGAVRRRGDRARGGPPTGRMGRWRSRVAPGVSRRRTGGGPSVSGGRIVTTDQARFGQPVVPAGRAPERAAGGTGSGFTAVPLASFSPRPVCR
ncbi:hypothetical protein [Streptomyces sp. WELS2]|uniref:hypothetical protein n=1 Tax=Streptomyces sp. WELS2 TaxID=2749435 RepID=UPI002867DD46|nr:hypothetical protein [Streptomyces sp. WELS2]